jgi:hypothetical protein
MLNLFMWHCTKFYILFLLKAQVYKANIIGTSWAKTYLKPFWIIEDT